MRTIAIAAAALVLTIAAVDAQRSRKTFPRTHPDPAFLCTETEKSTLHPGKYYIFKNVYEGIDIDNNTVRDVPKATDRDDLTCQRRIPRSTVLRKGLTRGRSTTSTRHLEKSHGSPIRVFQRNRRIRGLSRGHVRLYPTGMICYGLLA